MPRSLKAYLEDILIHSAECKSYANGKTYLAYSNDSRLRRAIERTLQIAGEAVTQAVKLDTAILLSISKGQQIMGLRNRLVHAYDDISDPIIWAVVQDHLNILEEEVRNLLLALPEDAKEEM
jgi:uncharacterized protein with HEPN domain